MRQPVFDCHKFTSNDLCWLSVSSLTTVTALVWVVTGTPVFAQVEPVASPGDESVFNASQFGFGGLLPVPQSPKVKTQKSNGAVIPPPPATALDAVNSNSFPTTHNLVASSPNLEDLENKIIQQQGRSSSTHHPVSQNPGGMNDSRSQSRFSTAQSSSTSSTRQLTISQKLGLGDRLNTKNQQKSSDAIAQNLPAQTSLTNSTTEFVAPGVPSLHPTHNQPTFNQYLNSSTTNSGYSSTAIAPLPPLPGETPQPTLLGNTASNSIPTFNQLLSGNRTTSSPSVGQSYPLSTSIGANPPTFNQLLNQSPVSPVPQQNQISNQQLNPPIDNSINSNPTFSQLFSAQGGNQAGLNDPIVDRNSTSAQRFPSNSNSVNRTVNQSPPIIKSTALTEPSLTLQGVYVTQGDDTSARARLSGILPLTPNALFGATLDLTSDGSSFDDSRREGLNINELYFATSLSGLPNLRFAIGQLDLTSYFDRNSFAKDGASQFFNPVFQTNPALSVAGISSRTGMLVNWSVTDYIDAKAAVFSSADRLSEFSLDGFAGEIGIRYGNAIIRGTYVTDRDAGNRDSFAESFSIARGDNRFGPQSDDREEAYGLNAEVFIPNLKMGLFGRYGRFENRDLGRGADTYVLGASFLDLFTADDRLGIAYGRELSNDSLRRGEYPDVVELFYDFKFLPNLRLGFTVQGRDSFEETVLGVRVKSEFDVTPRGSINR